MNYAADLVRIGESAAAPAFRSRYANIQNVGRRGGTLDAGVYDINLVQGKSKNCTVIAANHSSEPTSGLRINFSESDGHTLVGVPPQGAVWPTKPTNVSSFFGTRAQFTRASTSARRWNVGDWVPKGVVTGSVGDRFIRTDGGTGMTFYVKGSGLGNTGWAAK